MAMMRDGSNCHKKCEDDGNWTWDYVDCLQARLIDGDCKIKSMCRDVTL